MHFTLLDRYAFEKRLRPVLKHEMVHAVQLHSLDLLFMEFVVAMLWFNPLIYVLLRSIRENHEYLADHYAHGDQDSLREYLECLRQRPSATSHLFPQAILKVPPLKNESSNARCKISNNLCASA